jgi:hypothetical protein
MKITVEINDETIRKAASLVMEHYKDEEFLNLLRQVQKFNHTKDSGAEVAEKIKNSNLNIVIKPYKTFSPWSNVIAYAKGDTIFFNMRKIYGFTVLDRANTIFHEYTHLINFSHRGNRLDSYNQLTVPYYSAKIFSDYIRENLSHLTEASYL